MDRQKVEAYYIFLALWMMELGFKESCVSRCVSKVEGSTGGVGWGLKAASWGGYVPPVPLLERIYCHLFDNYKFIGKRFEAKKALENNYVFTTLCPSNLFKLLAVHCMLETQDIIVQSM